MGEQLLQSSALAVGVGALWVSTVQSMLKKRLAKPALFASLTWLLTVCAVQEPKQAGLLPGLKL